MIERQTGPIRRGRDLNQSPARRVFDCATTLAGTRTGAGERGDLNPTPSELRPAKGIRFVASGAGRGSRRLRRQGEASSFEGKRSSLCGGGHVTLRMASPWREYMPAPLLFQSRRDLALEDVPQLVQLYTRRLSEVRAGGGLPRDVTTPSFRFVGGGVDSRSSASPPWKLRGPA
jgi:hypothetical protein